MLAQRAEAEVGFSPGLKLSLVPTLPERRFGLIHVHGHFRGCPVCPVWLLRGPGCCELLSLKTLLWGLLRAGWVPVPSRPWQLLWRDSGSRCPQVPQWPRPKGLNGGHEPAPS